MQPTLGPRRLRELFARHGARPDKALGQNFVVDPNTIRKVVDVADVQPDDHICEIGAGAGSLTLELSARARLVTAIEFDRRLLPVLREVLTDTSNVEVVEADALEYNFSSVEARVVANLPYNIAATLVLRLLETAPGITDLTVMTQREVGGRLAAGPGDKSYGAISVLVAYWARARVAASISRRAFWPVPNVDSVLVRLVRHEPWDVPQPAFYTVVKSSFSQRRKTLRNNLAVLAGSTDGAEDLLRSAGTDPSSRAEELEPHVFIEIARALG